MNNYRNRPRAGIICLASLIWPVLASLTPATAQCDDRATKGEWGPVMMNWPNVAIHTHVLPTGNVLFWGRRIPGNPDLDVQDSQTWLWNPNDPMNFQQLPPPNFKDKNNNNKPYNPFCSGHAFLTDGRLLVAGGHIRDSQGSPHASLFDPKTNTWNLIDPDMNAGRWYPTVVSLANGSAVVTSGTEFGSTLNEVQQVLDLSAAPLWRNRGMFGGLPLYPRMFLAPDSRVFMTGWFHSLDNNPDKFEGAFLFDTNSGQWTRLAAPHRAPIRDYFGSVMYDRGKIAVFGGGEPVDIVEIIDLTAAAPSWTSVAPMKFARRQHNATLLPDGTVLITGGTRGKGFNNLDDKIPIHTAELWNPQRIGKPDEWSVLSDEKVDRCYHATAVLLPDATVLSAGGGEYRPETINGMPNTAGAPNPEKDTHKDAQVFSPPYLFRNTVLRPVIDSAPATVSYGTKFEVKTSTDTAQIKDVNWVRLSSVTHSFNQNQRINFLKFATVAGRLQVSAPGKREECPPGHYMLFLLNTDGVPSVAKIIQIQ